MMEQGGRSISRRDPGRSRSDAGYAMVALLVGLSIMAVMLSVALPAWRTMVQRERESELIFRGQQYAHAISLFQRKYANAFPPNLDILVDQKFLRRKYSDPVTGGEFQLLYVGQAQGPGAAPPGQAGQQGTAGQQGRGGGLATPPGGTAAPAGGRAGIMGVSSKSDAASLRVYNGRSKYNEWMFVATQATTRAGAPNSSQNPTGGIGGRGTGPLGTGTGAGTARRGGPAQPGDGGRRGGGNGPAGGRPTQPFGGGQPQPFGRGGRL